MQGVMIVSLEPKEFVSCGQQACSQHPGLLCLHFHQSKNLGSSQSTLLGTFSQVTLDDKPQNDESWKLRNCNGIEEELYLSGNTVVWSRGHVVLKTFTVDTPVKQAVWCKFSVDGEDPHQFDLPKSSKHPSIEGVSVVADGAVHVYSEDGDNYVTALPFQVRDVWCFKYGLLLERLQSSESAKYGPTPIPGNGISENDLTTIFCLQHPLREFSPVIMKNQGSVRYMNKANDTVVYCENDFIMTCDQRHGLHTVWKARQVLSDDINSLQSAKPQQQHQISSLCHMSLSSPGLSPYRGGSYRGSPIGHSSSNIGTSYIHNKTPHTNRHPPLSHLSYTPHSSKAFSPGAGSMLFQSNAFSPLRHSPHLTRSPCTPLSHESLCLNNSVHESAEPLRPELCFDHMWTESLSGTREGLSVGKATKVFQTIDLCNQSYLVYHIDGLSQLRVVRYTTSNDLSHLIFGAVTCITARDAAPLVNHNMFAVLDLNGFLLLYSGYLKVVKMNVSGLPLASLSLSQGLRSNASVPATPQPISTPAHPSRPASAMGNLDEVGLLSPVPELAYSGSDINILTGDEFAFSTSAYTSKLSGIPHVVGSTLVLEIASGKLYRVYVPSLCSSELVDTCLKAMRYTLPNDTYLSFATKWYSTRHAPGALNGQKAEWSLFVDCLLEYLGYVGMGMYSFKATGLGESMDFDLSASPVIAAKKSKPTENVDSKDWEYLLNSSYSKQVDDEFDEGLSTIDTVLSYQIGNLTQSISKRRSIDGSLIGDSSHLSSHLMTSVFSALHLVYEEQKLSTITWSNVHLMSSLLFRLAKDLHHMKFLHSYALHNPALMQAYLNAKSNDDQPSPVEEELDLKLPGSFSPAITPSVFENLDDLITLGACKSPFPYIPGVTVKTERVLKIYDCLFNKSHSPSTTVFAPLMKTAFNISQCCDPTQKADKFLKEEGPSVVQKVLTYMVSVGIDQDELMVWPHGVALAVHNALRKCSANPDLSFSPEALALLGRSDLLAQIQPDAGDWQHAKLCPSTDPLRFAWEDQPDDRAQHQQEDDEELISLLQVDENGITEDLSANSSTLVTDDNVTRLLFPTDHRMADAHNLLYSTKPSKIFLVQQAGVDDREYMEQKQYRLLQLLNRTMSLSVGRGMLHFRSQQPSTMESLTVPTLDLTGKDMNNSTITLANSDIELPSETTEWPYFHNGVAAALALQMEQKSSELNLSKVTSPQNLADKAAEPSTDHAGVLFGLGLNHHLQELQTLNIHDYLQKIHELTTIGLLLGLASDKCGSCDLSTMRVLSVHISALLPATSTQLDIPYRVQTAAVSAVGFLYLGSAQRLVAEVMLREIDRSPNNDSEVCTERESYALSAGFALGMVTLGRGNGMPELSDLNMSDKLFHFMTGKHKQSSRSSVHWSHEAYSPSHNSGAYSEHQILEGDHVNTEVTGPGATVALALMYLKTNNGAVADWFIPPNTFNLLETIKPQQLLLRTLSRSLILWDQIVPTIEWISSHVPPVVSSHLTESGHARVSDSDESEVDEHTVLQCHASIIAGACLALGLRFAGSQEKTAYDTLLHYVNFFLSILKQTNSGDPMNPLEVIGRRLFDTCLSSCLIALCLVVAGSGNLKALQICRYLHYSLDGEINYGTQMAIHMGLGFLFLGKCRYTLCTTNKAIAALLVSIYPCFPAKSCDNRYHLQALRHMYVLATEKRLLVPIDVSRKRPCYARVAVQYLPTPKYNNTTVSMVAPCMLPEASALQSVSMNDQRYWPMLVDTKKHPDKLQNMLENGMYVQLKAGCLSYIQDPKGYCSFLSFPKRLEKGMHSFKKPSVLKEKLPELLSQLSQTGSPRKDNALSHIVMLMEDIQNPSLYFVFLNLLETCFRTVNQQSVNSLSMWQVRMARSLMKNAANQDDDSLKADRLLKVAALKLDCVFKQILSEQSHLVKAMLHEKVESTHELSSQISYSCLQRIACYLIYHNAYYSQTSIRKTNFTLKSQDLISSLEKLSTLKSFLPHDLLLQMLHRSTVAPKEM
uniref:Anaphase-promoting complex subunit 1-like n=1 Tax=Phallusia mammillata TaxID=59560 RepID=A0A6F9DAV1_9ASCI|nr:anaphase-promoting complex subunit 1-like [Phallusia mammillata]